MNGIIDFECVKRCVSELKVFGLCGILKKFEVGAVETCLTSGLNLVSFLVAVEVMH